MPSDYAAEIADIRNHPDYDSVDDDWEPTPRRRYRSCSDRMCGADDCPRCHPEILYGPRADEREEEEEDANA